MKVLLISEKYIKDNFNIDDNLSPKYIMSAIRQAQNSGLKPVLGSKLYKAILSMVSTGEIKLTENELYKSILDEAQDFLGYETISRILVMHSAKIENLGVIKTKDDNTDNASLDELLFLKDYYQSQSDYTKKQLQEYILSIKDELPKELICKDMVLDSAYSGGVFLGGVRGRIL